MGTKEFLAKYPQWQEAYDNREYVKVGNSRPAVVKCVCSICGKESTMQWNKKSRLVNGEYRCKSCSSSINASSIECDYSARAKKRADNLTQEQRSGIAKKAYDTRVETGVQDRLMEKLSSPEVRRKAYETNLANGNMEKVWKNGHTTEAHAKAYATAKKNGTFMRSKLELQIEEEFGGQHSDPSFKYELDCYWPELHKGIEVDDPKHYESATAADNWHDVKMQGYHKNKDDYFRSLGIEVLHITLNKDAPHRVDGTWRDLVKSFLDGTYTGPLIDVTDSTYGEIFY